MLPRSPYLKAQGVTASPACVASAVSQHSYTSLYFTTHSNLHGLFQDPWFSATCSTQVTRSRRVAAGESPLSLSLTSHDRPPSSPSLPSPSLSSTVLSLLSLFPLSLSPLSLLDCSLSSTVLSLLDRAVTLLSLLDRSLSAGSRHTTRTRHRRSVLHSSTRRACILCCCKECIMSEYSKPLLDNSIPCRKITNV